MNRTVKFLLLLVLVVAGMDLAARQKSNAKVEKAQSGTESRKVLYPNVYLGQYEFAGGPIKKGDFDRLLKRGVTSKDSAGNKYKVIGFEFDYYERQLYEDSIGNLKVMTDILSEYCPGDTISGNVAYSIYDRSKPGDSVFLDRVKVVKYIDPTSGKTTPETEAILAKVFKAYIVK
jgi:hypothetical protein